MGKIGLLRILFSVSMLFFVLSPGAHAEGKTVTATDGASEVVLPAGWAPIADLNEKAEIEVGNSAQGLYLIVLTEAKDQQSEQHCSGKALYGFLPCSSVCVGLFLNIYCRLGWNIHTAGSNFSGL